MKRWVFILGRLPDLGVAETLAVLGSLGIQHTSERIAKNVLLIECGDDVDLVSLHDRLGGTIKIGLLDQEYPRELDARDMLVEALKPDSMLRFDKLKKGRWTFGISLYGVDQGADVVQSIRDFGLDIKRYFKSRKRSARFVAARGHSQALSSVVVKGNGLLGEAGAEILLIVGPSRLYRAITQSVQDFEAYSKRDYGRPERNPKAGSLPPKLAQTLLNLAGQKSGALVHDPFCGIGTILQEGLLMGYIMSGSDSDKDQVQRTRKNLEWLAQTHPVAPLSPQALAVSEAQSVSPKAGSINALVTEGVLGPPRSTPFDKRYADTITQQLRDMWLHTLRHWKKKLLTADGVVVMTLPALKTSQGRVYVPLLDDLAGLGYRLDTLVPSRFMSGMAFSERNTLVYDRPDQVVGREVIKLMSL